MNLKFIFRQELLILIIALSLFYSISYSQIRITDKSPQYQRDQSFIFPQNFTQLQTPLYKRFIYLIIDGFTYDFIDKRVKTIPFQQPECATHTHKINVFNDLLMKSPSSVVFQRLEIDIPPKTEIKISTYLKGINPAIFSQKIPHQDPYYSPQEDSIFYQLSQSNQNKRNYGYLTYFIYDYVGYYLTRNYFSLNPYYDSYEGLKQSETDKINEYISVIKSKDYDTLFLYAGLFDEAAHQEGMHTENVVDSQIQIDQTLKRIIESMDEESILLVTSDHGKSESGHHFGCRDEDILTCNSIFFSYTMNGFIDSNSDQFIQSIRRKEKDSRIKSQANQYSSHESQISNTISNLLNIPISYINSGRTLFELYPKNKFINRIDMLQRILQDSFSTLQQQKILIQKIQSLTNIFEQNQHKTILNDITKIEQQLFYEDRTKIIYSEVNLEKLIKEIINIQDNIQETIYQTKFYSPDLLLFGILFSSIISLKILGQSFIKIVIRNRNYGKYIYLFLQSTISCYFLFKQDEFTLKYGILIITLMITGYYQYTGRDFNKIIIPFIFLIIQSGLISQMNNNSYFTRNFISAISEIMLFNFYLYKILNKKQKNIQNNTSKIQINLCILIIFIEGYFRWQQQNLICLLLNIIFYIYSQYIEGNNINNKTNIVLQKIQLFDIIILNIIYCFLGVFNFNNNYIKELSQYYPIVLTSIYLFTYLIIHQRSVFNSFFLRIHTMIFAGILFEMFGYEIKSFESDFSIILIILFYLPLSFIGNNTNDANENNQKQEIQKININNEHLESFETIVINQESQQNNLLDQNEQKIQCNDEKRSGLALFSVISILLCCIGQLLIIRSMKVFALGGDSIVFQTDYLLIRTIAIIIPSLFIS